MPGNEQSHNDPERAWKDQEGEQVQMTLDEIRMRARAVEKKSMRDYWLVLALLAAFMLVAAVRFFQFSAPVVKMGLAFGIGIFLYIGLRWARNGPPKRLQATANASSCIEFLRTELERKRERLLEIRLTLLLLFPAGAAGWWGGGGLEIARRLGIDAPWYTRFQESPAPLVAFAGLLAFMWIGFGKEARAIRQEIEKLDNE
jgi:hypothetical protein